MLSPPVPYAKSAACSSSMGTVVGTTYVATGEVTTLEHELGDDAVEGGTLVVKRLSRLAGTPLAGAEGAEVLGGLSMVVSGKIAA